MVGTGGRSGTFRKVYRRVTFQPRHKSFVSLIDVLLPLYRPRGKYTCTILQLPEFSGVKSYSGVTFVLTVLYFYEFNVRYNYLQTIGLTLLLSRG